MAENIWQFKELKLYSDTLSSKMINLNENSSIIVINLSVNKKNILNGSTILLHLKNRKISNVEILNKAIFNNHKD